VLLYSLLELFYCEKQLTFIIIYGPFGFLFYLDLLGFWVVHIELLDLYYRGIYTAYAQNIPLSSQCKIFTNRHLVTH
jgi:hypothetical protein